MYDIIGDVHGCADELMGLLERLGFQKLRGVYAHPTRQAIFVGDLIDRGPKIREVLALVRAMVDVGSARVVMGNHEYNALAYDTEDPKKPGTFLRPHSKEKVEQHRKTLEQIPNEDEWRDHLAWFRTLPLWIDDEGLRIVHACWDDAKMDIIRASLDRHGGMTTRFLAEAADESTALYRAVEDVLKGKEVKLPEGGFFGDKGGARREEIRIRWFEPSAGRTFSDYALSVEGKISEEPLPKDLEIAGYEEGAPPVFVGHYWLRDKQPAPLMKNVACVDYSAVLGGKLCAYRWDGEATLSRENFVCVAGRRDGGLKACQETFRGGT
ncbi:MAG: metallophosphoesterase [Deltaproteobacteria bacterium]|nr:metallophosphoesterase [Deltaproteobacteria bacterium]